MADAKDNQRSGGRLAPNSGGKTGRKMSGCLQEFVQAVVSGEFAEGATLPAEAELLDRFDVSRTTLRETMQYMSAQGLIRSRPRAGTVVQAKTAWQMLDPIVLEAAMSGVQDASFHRALLEARELLEPAAARLAAERGDTRELLRIAEAFDAMADAGGRENNDFSKSDLDFHTAILEASGNWVFAQFGIAIRAALLTSFRKTNRASQSFEQAIEMHRVVMEAIRMRRPDEAEAGMRALISLAKSDMDTALEESASKVAIDPAGKGHT
ncbi:FadR/GntR family transcriptional regulator [Gymnodinialimonas ulvae]|uniref:FadR/GntR family transcriptional regulator n=1 Tax=Gymnodinialimonas ulvae TaxID=3126504 RepID=UPI0030A71281